MTWIDFVVFHFLTLLYRLSIIMFVSFTSPNHHGVPDYPTEFNISMQQSPGNISSSSFHLPEAIISFYTVSNRSERWQILKKCSQPGRMQMILSRQNNNRLNGLESMLTFSIFLKFFLTSLINKVTFCKTAFTKLLFTNVSRFLATFIGYSIVNTER